MKQTKASLSVVLAVHNEAARLRACLEAIQTIADEIIVVDGASDDGTAELAEACGAKVIVTSNKRMFHTNKQMAIDAAVSDWVLQLDADEIVDDELLTEISQVLHDDPQQPSAFYLKRKNFFLGKFLTKGGQYPDPVIRFFRRGSAALPQKDVHEQMVVQGEVGLLDGHLLHYNAPSFQRYIENANRYTTLTAQNMLAKQIRPRFIQDIRYFFLMPIVTWFQLFVRHRGYKDGFAGFVFALFSGIHHTLAYMKLADLLRHERPITN